MLGDAVSAAGHGRPSVTFVSGEAGIGKSRLIREVERCSRAAGALVLRGECIELGKGEFPYAPLVGALRDAGDGPLAAALARMSTEGRAELARLVPTLAGWSEPPPHDASTQGALFELLLALLGYAGEDATVLLLIEDAHVADTATRDFLSFMTHNLSDERLAVVVTYRSDDVRRDHPLRTLIAELIRCDVVDELVLPRLEAADLERLLTSVLGHTPASATVEQILARSQGNPFFAEELALGPQQLPESLRDALLVRVEGLPPDALAVAQALAVVGRPAPDTLLGALSGLDDGRLARALRAGLDANVLVRHGRLEFEFRHALVREAVLDELLPGELARLHRHAAETLDAFGSGTAGELAFHWDAAGDGAAALPAMVLAGLEAERVHASADALRHFERALELLSAVGPVPAMPLDRVEVLQHAAEAARLVGEWEQAATFCREALTLLDAAAEPARVASLYERLGEYLLWRTEEALECYSTALGLLPETELTMRARLLAGQALKLHFLQRWPEALALARQALDTALRAGARAEEGQARYILGIVLAFLGDAEEGEAHARAARQIAEETGQAEPIARAYMHLAEVLRLRGRTAEALELMLDGEKRAARLGMSNSFGRAMGVMAAEDQLKLGLWSEADARLERSSRLGLRKAPRLLHAALWARLAALRGEDVAGARLEAARALCDEQTPPEYLTDVYHCAAELALWRRNPVQACAEIAAALRAIGDDEDPLYTPVLYWLGLRAEADAASPRRPCGAAETYVARLEALIARNSLREPPPEAQAYLLAGRAEAGRVAGHVAPELWQGAAAAFAALELPYVLAYLRWREAEAIFADAADGARGRAKAALDEAREIAQRLGAAPLLAEIEALARAARMDAPAAATAEPHTVPADSPRLTSREFDVLELLAEGLTNREISARLFIAEKTTTVHVSHILSKLDAGNRTAAVAAARRLGLFDTAAQRG